jgi:hypothetical protein
MIRLNQLGRLMAGLGTTSKVLIAIAVSAALAGGLQILLGAESQVSASATAFSDRFIVDSTGSGCSERNWPYYEPHCLRAADGRHPRPVPIVTTDRLLQPHT